MFYYMKFSDMPAVDAFAVAPYLPKAAFIGTNFVVTGASAVSENDQTYMEVIFKTTKETVCTKWSGETLNVPEGVEHKYRFYPPALTDKTGAEGSKTKQRKFFFPQASPAASVHLGNH